MLLNRNTPHRRGLALVSAALLLAACATTTQTGVRNATPASAKPNTTVKKTPIPTLTAGPGKTGEIVSNGGAKIDYDGFAAQLQDLAAIEHNRAAATLLSNNAAGVVSNNGGTLLSNNAAGLIANNSGGLVSNNSGGLVSNNSGGLVSNNSGGLIANNAGGYRLLQAALPAFSAVPLEGEDDGTPFDLPDGTKGVVWYQASGDSRIVVSNQDGKQLEEQRITKAVRNAADVLRSSHTERTLVYGNDHRSRGFLAYDETYDDQARLTSITHQPSRIEEPISKLKIVVNKLQFTVEPPAGAFDLAFEHLGAVETGTITQVVRDIQGKGVGIDLADPLASMGGTSTFKTTSGKLLFTRETQVAAGQPTKLLMDMQDGWALALTRATRTAPWTGAVTYEGKAIGTATLTRGADAAVTYAVTFDGDAKPITIDIPEKKAP